MTKWLPVVVTVLITVSRLSSRRHSSRLTPMSMLA